MSAIVREVHSILNHRLLPMWLLAIAVLMSTLSLVTHLVANIGYQGAESFFTGQVYRFELFFVCVSTLVLLKLKIDENQERRRKHDKALRDDVVREHQKMLHGQARALDAHAIVSISSPTGQLLEANDNFREFFGYHGTSLEGASNDELYPGGRSNPTHLAIAQAMREGKAWQGKQSLRKLNGEPVTVSSTVIPVHDEEGQRTHNICIRTDITELDRAEANKMLSQLMGDLREEVYVYEVDSLALIYANKAACARCNWPSENVTKLNIADTSKNFDLAAFQEHTRPLIEEGKETVSINTIHDKGPVEATTRIISTPSGKQLFVSVVRDTAEQYRIDKARLESLSEASHELRSPLTSIKGSLSLLEAGVMGPLPEKAAELISVSRRSTDRLIGMINNVLDYEKLKSGTMDVEKCPIDLNDVLRKSAEMMTNYSDQHNVSIELSLPKNPTLVNANTDRLVQVLINLISNAVKYSPENGSVVAKVESDGRKYRVSVADNGPGVPDDAKELIFESFGQADALDGIKRHGTGLGLAISQKILKTHQTKMEISTEQGRGSQFHFSLPKLDAASLK